MKIRPLSHKEKENTKVGMTAIVYYTSIVAVFGMLILSLRYLRQDYDTNGQFALILMIMGCAGLFMQLYSLEDRVTLIPTQFKEFETENKILGIFVFVIIIIIQFTLSQIQFNITTKDRIAYHLFSAVIEELFYRGFVMEIILKIENEKKDSSKNTFLFIFTAVMTSTLFFMGSHFNYWGDGRKMFGVFLAGLVFSLSYLYKRDLTIPILGHFLLNLLVTITSAGVV